MTGLTAIALVCSLTPSPEPSSSEIMARHVLDELEKHGVNTSSLRLVDHDIKPGVQIDMGHGDAWPGIREQILAADILVLSTPIWMGHPCSIAQQVMERLDADLSETDGQGRPIMYGKVATVAVVGNEDGAHKTIADMMQGLNDIGFTIPAQGATYWVGEPSNRGLQRPRESSRSCSLHQRRTGTQRRPPCTHTTEQPIPSRVENHQPPSRYTSQLQDRPRISRRGV